MAHRSLEPFLKGKSGYYIDRLRREEIGAIVDIQLKRLQKLLDDRKITLDIDDKARIWIADRGYDPAYGARPLKRVIQRAVQDPLSELILSGALKDGDTAKVTSGADGLIINGRAFSLAA